METRPMIGREEEMLTRIMALTRERDEARARDAVEQCPDCVTLEAELGIVVRFVNDFQAQAAKLLANLPDAAQRLVEKAAAYDAILADQTKFLDGFSAEDIAEIREKHEKPG